MSSAPKFGGGSFNTYINNTQSKKLELNIYNLLRVVREGDYFSKILALQTMEGLARLSVFSASREDSHNIANNLKKLRLMVNIALHSQKEKIGVYSITYLSGINLGETFIGWTLDWSETLYLLNEDFFTVNYFIALKPQNKEDETIQVCKDWVTWIERTLLPERKSERNGYNCNQIDLEKQIEALEKVIAQDSLNAIVYYHPMLGQEIKAFNREWLELWEKVFLVRGNNNNNQQNKKNQGQGNQGNQGYKPQQNYYKSNDYSRAFGYGDGDDEQRLGGFYSENQQPPYRSNYETNKGGGDRRTETYDRNNDSTSSNKSQIFDIRELFSKHG